MRASGGLGTAAPNSFSRMSGSRSGISRIPPDTRLDGGSPIAVIRSAWAKLPERIESRRSAPARKRISLTARSRPFVPLKRHWWRLSFELTIPNKTTTLPVTRTTPPLSSGASWLGARVWENLLAVAALNGALFHHSTCVQNGFSITRRSADFGAGYASAAGNPGSQGTCCS